MSAVPGWIVAGQDRRPRRRARRRCSKCIREPHALAREPVDVRGLCVGAAVGADILTAEVVGDKQHDVRQPLCLRLSRRRCGLARDRRNPRHAAGAATGAIDATATRTGATSAEVRLRTPEKIDVPCSTCYAPLSIDAFSARVVHFIKRSRRKSMSNMINGLAICRTQVGANANRDRITTLQKKDRHRTS